MRNLLRFLPNYQKHRAALRVRLGRPFLEHLPGRLSTSAQRREFRRHRTLDPPPNQRRLAAAIDSLRQIFPDLGDVSIARCWAGYIDFTPDLIPVIDRLDRPHGFIFATGFSGHGFGMGPIVGRLVSELILDGTPSLDLEPFRFSRFSDGTKIEPRSVI